MTITILNLEMGNLGSIPNMLKRLHCPAVITADPAEVLRAKKLILPGVGAFDAAMSQLAKLDLVPALNHKVLEEKIPTLGICLGMQLLTESSEEGNLPGLGWIPGRVVRFRFADQESKALKVPHMGWNHVRRNLDIPLLAGYEADPRFYFVHSYHVDAALVDNRTQAAFAHYGYDFPAVIRRENVVGAQFHPEKSHRFGLKLLENFVRFDGRQLAAPASASLPEASRSSAYPC